MADNALVTPSIVAALLVTARSVVDSNTKGNPVPHLPLPSEYLDVAIVYGVLALIPGRWNRLAGMVGWGYAVATALNMTGVFAKLAAKEQKTQVADVPTSTGN